MIATRTAIGAELHRQLGRIGAARHGTTCLLTGGAGAGKTHVAQHFLGQLPTVATLSGDAPATGTPPLLPICKALSSDPKAYVHDAVSATLYEYSQSVPILKEALGPLLRVQKRLQHGASVAQEIAPRETHTFFVLAEMLRRVTEKTPAVLFLDDVQWLDTSSLAFLGFLASELPQLPLLVLLSGRSNGTEPETVRTLRSTLEREGDRFVALHLGGLALDEVVDVTERILKGQLDCTPSEIAWLQRTSRGNPQYLREAVSTLANQGTLARKGDRWRFVRPPDSLVLPPSYRELVLERFGTAFRADEDAAASVYHGAVLGQEFDARLIGQLLDRPIERVMWSLSGICKVTGLVQRVGRTTTWRFDHELTRDAMLDEMGDLCRDIHRRVGSLLVRTPNVHPRVPAEHLRAAGDWSDAATQYRRAAVHSLRHFAFSDAASAARECDAMLAASDVPPGADVRMEATMLVGQGLLGAQEYDNAHEFLSRLPLSSGSVLDARLKHLLARAKLNLADMASRTDAIALLRPSATAMEHEAPVAAADAWSDLVIAYDSVGDRKGAQAAYTHALKQARLGAEPAQLARVLRLTCIFWQPEKVIETTDRALRIARTHRLRFAEAQCQNNLGTQYWYLRKGDAARQAFGEARQLLTRFCGSYRLYVPLNNLGIMELLDGQVDDGTKLLADARARTDMPGDRLLIEMNLAIAIGLSGDLAQAITSLENLVEQADRNGDPFYRDSVRFNLGRALILAGEPRETIRVATAVPPRVWLTDEDLVLAKRAVLIADAHAALGEEPPIEVQRACEVLHQTTKPQAWLYRLPWELCDLQFWQD